MEKHENEIGDAVESAWDAYAKLTSRTVTESATLGDAVNGYTVTPAPNRPCPSCGHCPSCGRGGRPWGVYPNVGPYTAPYRPFWDGPYITYTVNT